MSGAASALRILLDRATGPMGPVVEPELGAALGGFAELGAVLAEVNGSFASDGGVQLFRWGSEGFGYDLETWNRTDGWGMSRTPQITQPIATAMVGVGSGPREEGGAGRTRPVRT